MLKPAEQSLLARRQVAWEEAGLCQHACLEYTTFASVRVLLGSEVKVLGRRGWFAEVKSHAWTLAVAGPRGSLRAKVSRELLDPQVEAGTGILLMLHGHALRDSGFLGGNEAAVGKREGSGVHSRCWHPAHQSREWEVMGIRFKSLESVGPACWVSASQVISGGPHFLPFSSWCFHFLFHLLVVSPLCLPLSIHTNNISLDKLQIGS